MAKAPLAVGSRYIKLEIDENGKTEIEAVGFNGVGCKEATKQLEINLGQVTGRKDKPMGGSTQGISR